jgi:hypothetical protein
MKHRLTAPLFAVLVLALAAFTGSALAGGSGANGSDGSNGNSANAPGQTKADQTPAAPAAAAPGQTKADQAAAAPAATATKDDKQSSTSAASVTKDDKQSSTSAAAPATGGSNTTGVKPSNTTDHDTYATASSDKTKVYGNGKTAGQIATQAGHGNAILHGPGNSQPHKTAPCPGGHEVDVHALKHKSSAACAAPQPQSQTVTPATSATVIVTATAAGTVATPAVVTPVATAAGAVQGAQATIAPAAASATPAAPSRVRGFAVTMKAPKTIKPAKAKPAGGVLGATKTLGGTTTSSTLPFTGLPLWIFALVAAGMIGVGLTLRRASANRI